ncbi:MAG TPA: hypothetical protein VL157_16040, partial [Gemmatimonadaceae bacterium]|nr:hypothetical protein [Gemmatimonadaceae bacterium]
MRTPRIDGAPGTASRLTQQERSQPERRVTCRWRWKDALADPRKKDGGPMFVHRLAKSGHRRQFPRWHPATTDRIPEPKMDTKSGAGERLSRTQGEILKLSHRIHAHPELGFEEERACRWLETLLADHGFAVTHAACELSTAFIARAGSGPLHVGICAEYDALPGIGHACGHNMIAAMAAGAAIAAAAVADDAGLT